MRVLLNEGAPGVVGADGPFPGDPVDDAALERLYSYPDTSARAWVRANMVATLDGGAAGNDGRTASINTEPDNRVFTLLRDLADVILVGAGTARVEGYRRAARRSGVLAERALAEGRGAHPAIAVVSESGGVPPILAEEVPDRGAVYLVTCEAAGPEALQRARDVLGAERVLIAGQDEVDLPRAVRVLHERGLRRVLCEGGPRLLADVAAAGVLDELCQTVVPLMAGGRAQRITAGTPADRHLFPRLVLEADGTLLHRWIRDGV
ncbi:pyrimidine reductase family protein [Nocardiopsis salina]|uniref:pyrimidine reductase family protein n=1 Tax=Nocardiopsis salina TaxID=245836 RepID=UPI00047641BD|nr:pyrimidine reductase family protein [Nocardiopsis salina]